MNRATEDSTAKPPLSEEPTYPGGTGEYPSRSSRMNRGEVDFGQGQLNDLVISS